MTNAGGTLVFALAPAQDAVVLLSSDLQKYQVLLNGYNGDYGLQATALTLSSNGQFLYVASPVEDSVSVFAVQSSGNPNYPGYQLSFLQRFSMGTGFVGPLSVVVSGDGQRLYVGGEASIAAISINSQGLLGSVLNQNTSVNNIANLVPFNNGGGIDYLLATDFINNRLYVLTYSGSTLAVQQNLRDGVNGITGLTGASGIAISSDQQFVYVTGAADNAVSAFQFSNGTLTEMGTYIQGVHGANGLIGASAVALLDTNFGHFLVVTGTTSNALAVFQRDPTTGALLFVQSLHNGVSGSVGLEQPNSLAVTPGGASLFVGSSAGVGAGTGGVALYTNLAFANSLPAPTTSITDFDNMDQFTLATGDGSDNLTVLTAPTLVMDAATNAPAFTIITGGGANTVTLDALPAPVAFNGSNHTVSTTVDLGTGTGSSFAPDSVANQVLVHSAVASTNLTIYGGDGGDTYNFQELGGSSQATVNPSVAPPAVAGGPATTVSRWPSLLCPLVPPSPCTATVRD